MSFKNFSKLEMLQNEYQWWCEQRIYAKQDGDIIYEKECDEACSMLFKQIKIEYENNNLTAPVVNNIKRRTFMDKVRKIFNLM